MITYTVSDSAGTPNTAAVTRTVVVTKNCKPPTFICLDQKSCSDPDKGNVCTQDLAVAVVEEAVVDEAPVMTLRKADFLKEFVAVKQFQPYEWCIGDQLPTEKLPCELGVDVNDKEEGPLTIFALVCPPASCLSLGCLKHVAFNPDGGVTRGMNHRSRRCVGLPAYLTTSRCQLYLFVSRSVSSLRARYFVCWVPTSRHSQQAPPTLLHQHSVANRHRGFDRLYRLRAELLPAQDVQGDSYRQHRRALRRRLRAVPSGGSCHDDPVSARRSRFLPETLTLFLNIPTNTSNKGARVC